MPKPTDATFRALSVRVRPDGPLTGDGQPLPIDASDPANAPLAKYGVQLQGKAFARARMGGVTRAISPPGLGYLEGGFLTGVSVGILTDTSKTLLNGGVFKEEVALHINLDDQAKVTEGTVSNAVKKLRRILEDGDGKFNGTVYGRVARGELPLVVGAGNKVSLRKSWSHVM